MSFVILFVSLRAGGLKAMILKTLLSGDGDAAASSSEGGITTIMFGKAQIWEALDTLR